MPTRTRERANGKIEVHVDEDRLLEEVSMDEWCSIAEVMGRGDDSPFAFQWFPILRSFVAKMVWDGKKQQYVEYDEAYKRLGPLNFRQLMEIAQQVFTAGGQAAVPPENGAESKSQ